MWGMAVVFVYFMRRVKCPDCGIRVEQVPWADGKSPVTYKLKWFLAKWAKLISWKEVASAFRVSWDCVFESVKQAVSWGLSNRSLDGIESIGIDEVQWHRGHKYQTLVYQIDEGCKRLLWIGPDRTAKTLLRFFRFLGKDRTKKLQFICSDMWQGYLKVIYKKASHAIHVLDRFHIIQMIGKAINAVRAEEVKQLQQGGYEPILKGARWVLLKRPENPTDKQAIKLSELLRYNLKSIRSHLMKEDFQRFWESSTAGMGRQVSRSMVYTRNEEQDRTDEEDREVLSLQARANFELVSSGWNAIFWFRRGLQQQSQTGYPKVLWL